MLPPHWEPTLVDLNIEPLRDADLLGAYIVFISAMSIQYASAVEIIHRCNELHKVVIAGGPLFTSSHDLFDTVDHFVLNGAELTLPAFIRFEKRWMPVTGVRSRE